MLLRWKGNEGNPGLALFSIYTPDSKQIEFPRGESVEVADEQFGAYLLARGDFELATAKPKATAKGE